MKNQSQKAEIRASVDSVFLADLEDRLGVSKSTDVVRAALSLLDWASQEVKGGRIILSSDGSGSDVHRLVMSELSKIRKTKTETAVLAEEA